MSGGRHSPNTESTSRLSERSSLLLSNYESPTYYKPLIQKNNTPAGMLSSRSFDLLLQHLERYLQLHIIAWIFQQLHEGFSQLVGCFRIQLATHR
jgi:hypothetical protein